MFAILLIEKFNFFHYLFLVILSTLIESKNLKKSKNFVDIHLQKLKNNHVCSGLLFWISKHEVKMFTCLVLSSYLFSQVLQGTAPPTPFGSFLEASIGGGGLGNSRESMSGPEINLSFLQKSYLEYAWGFNLKASFMGGTVYQEDDPSTPEDEEISDRLTSYSVSFVQRIFLTGDQTLRPYLNLGAGLAFFSGSITENQDSVSGMEFFLGGGLGAQVFLLPLVYGFAEFGFNLYPIAGSDFDIQNNWAFVVGVGVAL